jgi:hypothetical protein
VILAINQDVEDGIQETKDGFRILRQGFSYPQAEMKVSVQTDETNVVHAEESEHGCGWDL